MVSKITTFIILACAVALTCGDNISEEPQPIPTTKPTTPPPTTKPTTPPPTTKPTPPPPTTKPTPPPPTTKPTTPPPTTKPTTTEHTTLPPTTTDTPYPQPNSTTSKPTTPSPTPKPSPKPPQNPDVGKWNVTDHENNMTCILVDMAIQLNITYLGNDNKTKYSIVNVPKTASASGSCGNDTQVLDLDWSENNKTFGNLSVMFSMKDTKHFNISLISLTVVPDDTVFPGIGKNTSDIVLVTKKGEFVTPISKSYLCEKKQSFVLKRGNGTNETDSEISVSHVHLQAFHTSKDANFGAAEDCEPSSSPDIVPIAVGCALVGLVAIVLIAYLVGRRRSQARGYLSM